MAWYHSLRKIRRARVQRQANGDVEVYLRGYNPGEPENVSIRMTPAQWRGVIGALEDAIDSEPPAEDTILTWEEEQQANV